MLPVLVLQAVGMLEFSVSLPLLDNASPVLLALKPNTWSLDPLPLTLHSEYRQVLPSLPAECSHNRTAHRHSGARCLPTLQSLPRCSPSISLSFSFSLLINILRAILGLQQN